MPPKILSLAIFLLFNVSFSQIVINEIDVDTDGTDQLEFIELKSATANFSLDGYVLVLFNAGGSAPYSNTVSYFAYDLDGYTTDVNGIAHFGNVLVVPSPMGNFLNQTIQNGPDVIALYQGNASDFPLNTNATTTNLIDAIAYSTNSFQPSNMMSILGISTCTNENLNGLKDSQSIQRKNDGTYEVKNPTPGANNDGTGVVINYITVTTDQPFYSEGDDFTITFTTDTPVTNTNLIINFTLVNGNFMVNDYVSIGGLTVSIPIGQTVASTTLTLFEDTVDEGDEEMLIDVQSLPFGYGLNNDNIIIRVYDNDYIVEPYGTPLNPTYGLVTPEIPIGYYDSLEGLSGTALKQAIQDIIADPSVVHAHNYGDIYDILKIADKNPENSNQVWEMYVERPIAILDQQFGSSNIGVWNREHIYPQSRGGFSGGTDSNPDGINVWLPTNANDILAGHADAHHIRAEDGAENSARSNKDYGLDYNGPVGSQGSWHGDVARALFYMAVRYNGLSLVNGDPSDTTAGELGDLASLLQWNTTDPADDFEMHRNNYIYTWQVNRNPFIDYPLLANYVFGENFGDTWSFALSNQNFSSTNIKVYPNPTTDYLMVSGLDGIGTVEMYTLTGQLVVKQSFENTTRLVIDLVSGVYLVKVLSGNENIIRKIVVQ